MGSGLESYLSGPATLEPRQVRSLPKGRQDPSHLRSFHSKILTRVCEVEGSVFQYGLFQGFFFQNMCKQLPLKQPNPKQSPAPSISSSSSWNFSSPFLCFERLGPTKRSRYILLPTILKKNAKAQQKKDAVF